MKPGKGESGSAMLLALIFLLFCMFTGSAVLASAAAAAGRSADRAREQEDFLQCRSAALLCRDRLWPGEGPSLTIRDVTVVENGTSRRTVTYRCGEAGDSLLLFRLIDGAIREYELNYGVPDTRRFENFRHSYQPPEWPMPLNVTVPGCSVSGSFRVESGGDGYIRLDVGDTHLVLTMAAVTGSSTPVTVSREGVTTVTRTTRIQWEYPVIGKGGAEYAS